MVISLVVELVG